jgi:cytosine deaminase
VDLAIRSARVAGRDGTVDIGVRGGTIVAIEDLPPGAAAEEVDAGGRLVAPGFVETHIHLDKSCILDRCRAEEGTLEEAIAEVAAAKRAFTPEDVHARGARTLEKCIANGTTHVRTHLEVDPGIGLRGLEGVLPLVDEYRWALDLEICVFPQEGLLNNPGTDELMVAALERGCRVVGAAPYTDSDPRGQIDRVFELARRFDVDIDMHLDFGATPDELDVEYVARKTEENGLGGRVTVGHVTKLSLVPPDRLLEVGRRLADVGVNVTVLPSTDLYLMGRHQDHSVLRGLTPVHRLLELGVN